MDGMAQPCGADIPDAEGSQHAHVGILQNAGGSVKPRDAICTTGANSEFCGKGRTGERRETLDTRDCRFRRFIESCSLAFLASRAIPATFLMPRRR